MSRARRRLESAALARAARPGNRLRTAGMGGAGLESGRYRFLPRIRRAAARGLDGPEEKLFDAMQLGGRGGVSGGANLFPKLYVHLVAAHRAGNLARAQELQKQIQRVSDSFYHIGKYSSSIIKGIKCVLASLGVCD